jgi:two-component system, OmpR family, sensor histidine kinase VicK
MEVCELRHIDGVRTNFAIADGKEALLHGISQETNPLSQAILTSVKGLVEAQEYLFDNLWRSAIPAQYKIREIEDGVKSPFIETLKDPLEIQKLGFELVKSAKQEIHMLLLPSSSNVFLREGYGQILIQLFKLGTRQGIRVRILTSKDAHKQIENLIEGRNDEDIIKKKRHDQQEEGKEDTGLLGQAQGKFQIHLIDMLPQQQQQHLQTKVSILIVDSKLCLVEDLQVYNKNKNNNNNSNEALSLATYSNSEPTVLTYISIFETLWAQTELKTQNKMRDASP